MDADVDATMIIGVAIATLFFLVFIVAVYFHRRKSKLGDTFLLLGLSASGKTKMYCRLITDAVLTTFTSQSENISAHVTINAGSASKTVTLIDVPGVDRVRKPRLLHWLVNAGRSSIQLKGIIVVVDSTTFAKHARDVAELVYDIMVCNAKCPLLIAANKQDLPQAKSAKLIRQTLAGELTLLQQSRSAQLSMTDGSSNAKLLHLQGDSFDWDNDAPRAVFVECACVEANDAAGDRDFSSLKGVREWMCRQ